MSTYRIYCMEDNHIKAVHIAECEGDDAARAKAAVLLAKCRHAAAEAWDRGRKICHIERSDLDRGGEATSCGCGPVAETRFG